jgi:hypothetical protein
MAWRPVCYFWQASANTLWELGTATRLTWDRKPAETHPTARLHPLGT